MAALHHLPMLHTCLTHLQAKLLFPEHINPSLSSIPLLLLFPWPRTPFNLISVGVVSITSLFKAFSGHPIKIRYSFFKCPTHLQLFTFLLSTYLYLTPLFFTYLVYSFALLTSIWSTTGKRTLSLLCAAVSPVPNTVSSMAEYSVNSTWMNVEGFLLLGNHLP